MTFQNSFQNGRYTILSQLGAGGIASVWRVFDTLFEMEKAIKVLQPHSGQYGQMELPSEMSLQSRTQIKRFFREAKVMMQLEHHNILRVYDYFEENGAFCIVMEKCMGSLDTWVNRNGPMPIGLAIQVTIQILQGLAQAHRGGLIHRDIKPHNILISGSGLIKVADFGLALNSMASDALTKTNALLGSVQFMSPEQRNDPTTVDIASDIYSVAQTLVWLLHGRTLGDLYVSATLTKLQEAIPLELVDIIKHAGQLEPTERYDSALDMIQALENIEISTDSQRNLLFGLELQEISIDDLHPSNTTTLPEVSTTQPGSVEMVIPKSLYGLLGVLTLSILGLIISVTQFSDDRNTESPTPDSLAIIDAGTQLPQCEHFIKDHQTSFVLGPRESYNVALQDINGDGLADAFFANLMDKSLSMYINDGTSRIDNIDVVTMDIPRMMTPPLFEDIDKDGLLDIVGLHNDQSRITILKGIEDEQFRPLEVYGRDEMLQEPPPLHGAFFDINEDGYGDLLFQERSLNGVYALSIRYNAKKGLDYPILNLPNTPEEPLNWHKRIHKTPNELTFGKTTPSIYWVEKNVLNERTVLSTEDLSDVRQYELPIQDSTLLQILLNRNGEEIFLFLDPFKNIIQWQKESAPCVLAKKFPLTEFQGARKTVAFGYWNKDDTLDFILAKTCTFCDSNHWLYVSQ